MGTFDVGLLDWKLLDWELLECLLLEWEEVLSEKSKFPINVNSWLLFETKTDKFPFPEGVEHCMEDEFKKTAGTVLFPNLQNVLLELKNPVPVIITMVLPEVAPPLGLILNGPAIFWYVKLNPLKKSCKLFVTWIKTDCPFETIFPGEIQLMWLELMKVVAAKEFPNLHDNSGPFKNEFDEVKVTTVFPETTPTLGEIEFTLMSINKKFPAE